MDDSIVSNSARPLKDDNYQSAHESLLAKLQQAQTQADIAANGEVSAYQIHVLICAVADLLKLACDECENLSIDDFRQTDKFAQSLTDTLIQESVDESAHRETGKSAKQRVKSSANKSTKLSR